MIEIEHGHDLLSESLTVVAAGFADWTLQHQTVSRDSGAIARLYKWNPRPNPFPVRRAQPQISHLHSSHAPVIQ